MVARFFQRPMADRNLKAGSVYIAKLKMHGPDEVAMVVNIFDAVKKPTGLPPLTMKICVLLVLPFLRSCLAHSVYNTLSAK